MLFWHTGDDNDCYQASTEDEEETQILEFWYQAVEKNAKGRTNDAQQKEGNVNMPRFDDVVRMEDCIHLNTDIGLNLDNGCKIEDPTKKVEESSEEAEDSAESRSWCNTGPVIYASRARDCGSKFCNAGADE